MFIVVIIIITIIITIIVIVTIVVIIVIFNTIIIIKCGGAHGCVDETRFTICGHLCKINSPITSIQ